MENINEYIVNTEWYPSNIVVMASLSVSTPGRSDKPSELRPYLKLKKSKEYKVIGKVKVIEAEALQHC